MGSVTSGLILKQYPQERDHHGKGEEGKECSQNIENNILCHIPLVGKQVF